MNACFLCGFCNKRLVLGTEQVVSSIPGSVGYISYPMFIVHGTYDYLGPFGVLWVYMA